MSVARVTTITARSSASFDEAVRYGIETANKTLRNITGAWVKEHKVVVGEGAITEWQVTLEVTFILE